MLSVLVNAYAVSPNWGSEQGMGWNWVCNLAKYNNVYVITEGEWQEDIEKALESFPYKNNLHFFYNPVSLKIRKMCWNQGDWRFYWYYRKWQKKTLNIAKQICEDNHIDIIHQLNMVGFREPGFLWKIKNKPFIWGPIGGMELMPMEYLADAPLKQKLFNRLKNTINKWQYKHSARVKKAIDSSSILISAVKGVKNVLEKEHGKSSFLINETGISNNWSAGLHNFNKDHIDVLWVGKFDFRKQLVLAVKSFIAAGNKDIKLHICGDGSVETVEECHRLLSNAGRMDDCIWYGKIDNSTVIDMMSKMDLFLFTSIMEATSTVVLEALTSGLPVLCFNTCGFGPIVSDFGGIAIPLSNTEKSICDFARELNKVENNRDILQNINIRITQNCDSLTWQSKAFKTTELYNKAITSFLQSKSQLS